MSNSTESQLRKFLPSGDTLSRLGLHVSRSDMKVIETLEAIHADVESICRETRRACYALGLAGGALGISRQAQRFAENEQRRIDGLSEPEHEESPQQFTHRLRRWRTAVAIRTLAVLDESTRGRVLGEISARLRANVNPENALSFFDEQGRLKEPITRDTPMDRLIDILAFTENLDALRGRLPEGVSGRDIENMRSAALEFLIRQLITEDPRLITIGSKHLKLKHFQEILKSVPGALGQGRIGGKAAGMLIADAVMESETPDFDEEFARERGINSSRLKELFNVDVNLGKNTSYFIGSALFDEIGRHNKDLSDCTTFKYHFPNGGVPPDVNEKYENLRVRILQTKMPEHIERQLKDLLKSLHGKPCIVRSSSELEDRFGAAFAGKYKSVYLANSKDFAGDFDKFLMAVKEVYASVFSPDVMAYRTEKGLIPYDEEMGVLVQLLNGEPHGKDGRFFYPPLAGVAMSHATQSWGPDPTRGAMTVVYGFGETAVNQGGRVFMFDNPASNPNLGQNKASQGEITIIDRATGEKREVDVYDLKEAGALDNKLATRVFSKREGKDLLPLVTSFINSDDRLAITLDGLSNDKDFPLMVEYIVQKLKHVLGYNVDVEFTAAHDGEKFVINLVQCRPQNIPDSFKPARKPEKVEERRVILFSNETVSCGSMKNIRYVVYVHPDCYKGDAAVNEKLTAAEVAEMRTWIRRVNSCLKKGEYIIIAPGRWGCNSPEQGVPVSFCDFSGAAGFVEVTGKEYGSSKPSFGTHFMQDVVECGMVTFAVNRDGVVGREFLDGAISKTVDFAPEIPSKFAKWLRVIDIEEAWAHHVDKPGEYRLHAAQDNTGNNGKPAYVYIAERDRDLPVVKEDF